MEIFCTELNKSFSTKQEMFKELKKNKAEIIGLKKSIIRKSMPISLNLRTVTQKGIEATQLALGDNIRAAINTTNYFDYDKDVLLNGSWTKTAGEQNGKTYHAINHELKLGCIVAYPKDVNVSVETLTWKTLGKDYSGETEVLVFESKMTEKTNKDAFLAYRDGEPVEHSASLQYMQMELAYKSNEIEDKEENHFYEKYYPLIANKEDVDKYEYFWAVTEVKLHKEGSTVLFGANDATPPLKKINPEPHKSTQKIIEPSNDTQKEQRTFYLNL